MLLENRKEQIQEVLSQLRPYQLDTAAVMVRDKRHLNLMEPGMGKSVTTETAIIMDDAMPCMIVCTKSAMYVWEEELQKWFGEKSIVYAGKPKDRVAALNKFNESKCNFIITNYKLAEELGQKVGLIPVTKFRGLTSAEPKAKLTTPTGTWRKFKGLIADEIHQSGLFNHKNVIYGVFKKLTKDLTNVYLLTGTPYRKGVVDFYGPLSIIRPDIFDSYWKYVNKWCQVIKTGFGVAIERNPKDVEAFRIMIRLYASILKQVDHLKDLPGKQRQIVPLIMEDEQARVYQQLSEELLTLTNSGEFIMSPSVLALTVRQRQLLACPQELGLECRGVAIDTMLEMSESLVEEAKPFVIFTPFKSAIKWISQALQDTYPGIVIYGITGGLTAEQFRDAWQGFQNHKGSAAALICVIKSSASFHATVAATAFFIGYEWDFNQNIQAEDRLNRIGQTKLVMCYYFQHKYTIDGEVLQKNNDKKFSSDLILTEEAAFNIMWSKLRGESG